MSAEDIAHYYAEHGVFPPEIEAEMIKSFNANKAMAEKAKRYNTGKLRYGLIPSRPLADVAEVYTRGAHKYSVYSDAEGKQYLGKDIPLEKVAELKLHVIDDGADNWRKGLSWTGCAESVERHFQAWKSGEDLDPELQTQHLANAVWGMLSLMEYRHTHPELDDRKHPYLVKKRIGLDIDEMLADFVGALMKEFPAIQNKPVYWNDASLSFWFEQIKTDQEFWLSVEPKHNPLELPFEPVAYITSRTIDTETTQMWLNAHGFPKAPVYTVGHGMSKVQACKDAKVDIFVDDSYSNFVELNKAGICTFLMDATHNRRYNVGYKRIKSLKELA
jgi:hypothetical protein